MRRSPARGQPLELRRWYVEPVTIPPADDGTPRFPAQQGDIFKDVPSVWIATRPLKVARDFRPEGAAARLKYTAINEVDAPQKPFDWAGGEDVVVRATRGFGILLTQDCELDKPKGMLTFAMIRLLDGSQHAENVEVMRNRRKYRSFYLEEQTQAPAFRAAYVDFGRLTTIAPAAINQADRLLSLVPEVRDALREDFIEFLNLEREEGA